jgi:hypothetical protein
LLRSEGLCTEVLRARLLRSEVLPRALPSRSLLPSGWLLRDGQGLCPRLLRSEGLRSEVLRARLLRSEVLPRALPSRSLLPSEVLRRG